MTLATRVARQTSTKAQAGGQRGKKMVTCLFVARDTQAMKKKKRKRETRDPPWEPSRQQTGARVGVCGGGGVADGRGGRKAENRGDGSDAPRHQRRRLIVGHVLHHVDGAIVEDLLRRDHAAG